MTLQTTLRDCHDALRESAKMHRIHGDKGHEVLCDEQADEALRWMEDPECHHSPARKDPPPRTPSAPL